MAYTYTKVFYYLDGNGRLVNLTNVATVAAYDTDGNPIAGASLTNIATGVYKVELTQDDLEDVIFTVIPHLADQAAFEDVCVMQDKITHVLDNVAEDVDDVKGYTYPVQPMEVI